MSSETPTVQLYFEVSDRYSVEDIEAISEEKRAELNEELEKLHSR